MENIKIIKETSATKKLITVAILTLLLLIPLLFVRSLVKEREKTMREAIHTTSSSWGESQLIAAPILTVPYETWAKTEGTTSRQKNILVREKHLYRIIPSTISIKATLNPEIRNRGIFKIPLYHTTVTISGSFEATTLPFTTTQTVLLSQAFISWGSPDLVGLNSIGSLMWNNQNIKLDPAQHSDNLVFASELNAPINFDPSITNQFSFSVELNGSESLKFLPLAKQAEISVSSAWASPSFTGRLLPSERAVSASGFSAIWKTNNLNMNIPTSWADQDEYWSSSSASSRGFGVDVFFATSSYLATERSVKYGLLFISLSFLTFFLFEIFNRSRLHPIQYLLVGFALCLFYTLLLSLSEHIRFGLAYFIASAGTVGLIMYYSASILKHKKQAFVLSGVLSGLYAYLYTLLQMEDYALLMGSMGLFVILAVVMLITRKLDWYAVGKKTVPTENDATTKQA